MLKGRAVRLVIVAGVVVALVAGGVAGVQWWRGRVPGKPYELEKVYSGTAYGRAKPFAGAGPHPISVFIESDSGYLEHEPLFKDDGSSWEPSDPRKSDEVQLVACARVTNEEPLEDEKCSYGNVSPSVSIGMVRATYQVRVFELSTHREVLSTLVEGLHTRCPYAVSGDDPPDRLLSEPTFAQWQKVLGDLVSKSR